MRFAMDVARLNHYLNRTMRLLLALLALLSGLSAPQVALAASPAEVAGQVLGAAEAVQGESACTLREEPRRTFVALRKVRIIRLPLVAYDGGDCGIVLSDRARE